MEKLKSMPGNTGYGLASGDARPGLGTDVRFEGEAGAFAAEHFDVDADEFLEDKVPDKPDVPPGAYIDEAIANDDEGFGTDHTSGSEGRGYGND
ncbi:hypothetical protein [Desulforudis sp. DRI-14]|uniref:hypothetical protein n=1 Tax=Desulforudis sp. DRI-14 TaxID=3459793 RepID=UPI004042FD0A